MTFVESPGSLLISEDNFAVKVLLVTDFFQRKHRTGLDMYCDQLISWLPYLAPDTTFALTSFDEADIDQARFPSNFKYVSVLTNRKSFFIKSYLGLEKQFKALARDFDLVHSLIPIPISTENPLLVTVHDLAPLKLPRIYKWYSPMTFFLTMKMLIAQGAHFIAVSDSTKHDLVSEFNLAQDRVSRIYEAVSSDFQYHKNPEERQAVRVKYGIPDRFFLFTGGMHKRKNLGTILDAYMLFRKQCSEDVKLVFTGRMELGGKKLIAEIRKRKIQQHVILPGYIDRKDLPILIGMAEVMLYLSLYEGFGFPVLEAMACGTPVICSNNSSLPEVAGKYALFCNALDVFCIVDKMRLIVENNDIRKQLIEGGIYQSQLFSWKNTAEKTLELYESVTSSRRRG